MKKFIPKSIKLNYRLLSRFTNDLLKGNLNKFAKTDRFKIPYNGMIETKQPFINSHLSENKIHNIKIATKEITRLQILPGEIFSFWKAVGKATEKKGYKTGRNLLGGHLKEDIGGGLCQLSGIIYHTALKANLEILERHPHSVDIYEEHQRYTPLGADAAVVYAYKDLRIKNTRGFPIKFTFIINDESISCRIFLEDNVPQNEVKFQRIKNGVKEKISTLVIDEDGNQKEIGVCEYSKK